MTATCESCGKEMMIVLDEDERIELRYVSADSAGRGIYVVDVVPKHPAPRRRKDE